MRACLSVARWQACVQYCTAFFFSVEITFFLAEGHIFLGTAGAGAGAGAIMLLCLRQRRIQALGGGGGAQTFCPWSSREYIIFFVPSLNVKRALCFHCHLNIKY